MLLLWSLVSGLASLLSAPMLGGVNVTLAWGANSETNLAGYNVYYGLYGPSNRTYINTINVSNAVTATISDLTAEVTYFFAVTAYNTDGSESDFSNEVSYPQTPPTISDIADQVVSTNASGLKVAFHVTDRETPADNLRFSASSSNPMLVPASGIVFGGLGTNRTVRVTPVTTQSGKAVITITVTDDGLPALSDTKTFTVFVGSYLEVSLGTAIVLAGQTGHVAIAVNTATPVTNIAFTADMLAPGLADFALESPMPPLSLATFHQLGPNQLQVNLRARANNPFYGAQIPISLRFRAVDNEPSAFIPLRVSNISASQPQNVPVGLVVGNDGRVVFINSAPLLEAQAEGPKRRLLLYAPPGPIHTVQCAPNLMPPVAWSAVWSGPVTNLVQILDPSPCGTRSFYRAIAP